VFLALVALAGAAVVRAGVWYFIWLQTTTTVSDYDRQFLDITAFFIVLAGGVLLGPSLAALIYVWQRLRRGSGTP
jgi:hypothetical protein